MKFILTNRAVDIKKNYKNEKRYKIYNYQYRRHDEIYRKNKGYFCPSQIVLDLKNNIKENLLINRNFKMISMHSEDCIKYNYRNLPEVKENLNEYNDFLRLVNKYLNNITFYDIKIIKNDLFNIYKENNFKFEYNTKKINDIINNFKKNSVKFSKDYIFRENKDLNNNNFLRDYSYFLVDTIYKKKV